MGVSLQNSKVSFLLFKFFLEFAFAAGFFASTSLFISRVGTFSLFYIYLISSILSLGLSYLFSKIIDRYSRRLIFFASFLALGILVLVGWSLILFFPEQKSLYFAIRIFTDSVVVLAGLEFWVLASLTFTHADSKKVFSQLVIVTILGEMAGGLFTGFASKWIGTENLLLIWGALLCISPLLFLRFPFPRPETAGFSTGIIWGEVQAPGTGQRSRAFFSSRLIQMLLIFWVVFSFICFGTDYAFNSFASQKIPNEDKLTEFFGWVAACASVLVLCYHLFIGPRLARRLGPTHSLLLACGIIALAWIVFSIHPSLTTIAIVDSIVFYFSDDFTTGIHSTILTVFPERVKGRIRVLTEGFGRPVGTMLLFLVAAVFAFHVSIQQINYWMLGGSLVFLTYPLWFRKPYQKHLLNCLHSRDQSLVLNSVQAISESPQTEAIQPLASLLVESKNFKLRRSVVAALEHIRNPAAMEKVLPILSNPDDPLHPSAVEGLKHCSNLHGSYILLGLLTKDSIRDGRLRKQVFQVLKGLLGKEIVIFLLGCLYDRDPQVQADSLMALSAYKDRRLIPLILPFLRNENPRTRAAACVVLYHFNRTRENVKQLALKEIQNLAASSLPEEQIAAFEAIGATGMNGYREQLQGHLKSQNGPLAFGAASALGKLQDPSFAPAYIQLMLQENNDPLALSVGQNIPDLPKGSRKILFKQIQSLEGPSQLKIWNRLKKTHLDFSREWGLEEGQESFFPAQIHV